MKKPKNDDNGNDRGRNKLSRKTSIRNEGQPGQAVRQLSFRKSQIENKIMDKRNSGINSHNPFESGQNYDSRNSIYQANGNSNNQSSSQNMSFHR